MRSNQFILISTALLITSVGFAETILTAQDYAVDSDVVLESAVREVKSIPRDTVNVIGDGVKYVKDEVITAKEGVVAVFKDDPHAKAQKDGELAVENAWDTSNDILFRSYDVTEEVGEMLLTGADAADAQSIDVSGFFKTIRFPEDTSAYYLPKFKRVMVRQTMENILDIENMLAEYLGVQRELLGHQVEIEAKFVEVNQSTMQELGFNWQFNGKDGGDLQVFDDLYLPTGEDLFAGALRTASQALSDASSAGVMTITEATGSLNWSLAIEALEQSGDSDVLCAPRVVTRDGSTAVIQVGEERMIPKSFEVNNQDTSPYVEHADWDLELMGVYMEVTPDIRDEGKIDLELHPKVVDLLGFESYDIVPKYSSDDVTLDSPVPATLPYLRIRELTTRMTVADGSTVGMGGLIYDKLETFRDKVPVLGSVPFLGRLFRSEGERSVKRNLMIFVTATQVDVDGRRSADVALKK